MSEILSTHLGAVTYLALTESPDEPGALAGLQDVIDKSIEALDIQVAIDLSNVRFLGSQAMEALLDANDRLGAHGGWLKVANTSAGLRKIFEISGFDRHVGSVDRDNAPPLDAGGGVFRLGDLLIERKLIDADGVRHAMDEQTRTGKRLGQVLIDSQIVPEAEVLRAISEQLGTPFVSNLKAGLFDPVVIEILPRETAMRLNALPLFKLRNTLAVALSDSQDIAALDEIEERSQCRVRPVLACRADIQKILSDLAGGGSLNDNFIADIDEDLELIESNIPDDYSEIDEMSAGSPIINLVNAIIQRAVLEGVSDIHIEPGPTGSRVRFRVDSILYQVMTPRADYHPAIVSRLKIMANLDIAERRMPQDGRIQVYTQKQNVDLRFSSLPGLHGEKVVLRVLDKRRTILDLNKLGFSEGNLEIYRDILTRSYGLILVTGPTGSGKTTSLYAGLNHLNSLEKNIVTVEDPVEYQLDIINQNEVRDAIGLSFSKMLKHILRQDPDIVMVGEIRERETAQIAVQAALTGHLVLSTLHTNDSVSAVTRMIDMGVEPYLLSSALVGVVAQRLVRTICPNCKTYFRPPPEM
ncbi:ATPase, T2SS/T4P/T4SS family, partial [Zhongshania sp.]